MAVTILARAMSEDELDDVIREACRVRSLLAYHTHDSRRSAPGFPDWVAASDRGRVAYAASARGTTRPWAARQAHAGAMDMAANVSERMADATILGALTIG